MAESILRDKSKEFAKKTILLCRALRGRGAETVLLSQFLRCGTSVGANIHEAQYAQSTKDFISKLEIALKECNESDYWADLLHDTQLLTDAEYAQVHNDCIELRRMMVSSITKLKAKE